jgi:hypothetical protein
MKKNLIALLAISALAGSAFANLQMDVPATNFPAGAEADITAEMYLFGNPTAWPATRVLEADGFPLMYHVMFEYDEQIPGGAVDHIDLHYFDCSGTWTPPMFTVFYQPGPSFPVDGQYDPMLDCGGGVVEANEIPTSFELKGAFPNPFNPTTTIEFALPTTEMVSLNVYNINGQLVNTLVDGAMDAGNHSVTFDAANLSSGVYLYTIEAGAYTATNKMVLVK